MNTGECLKWNNIYTPQDIKQILELIKEQLKTVITIKYNFEEKEKEFISYYNLGVSFDIETTSTKIKNEKIGIMYEWSFCIGGLVIIGRTWEEFLKLLDDLRKELKLNYNNRLIIYVHNLGYEFQFMRKWIKWDNVFSIKQREPIYAISDGIEFRCSYILSGYSLEKMGEELQEYKLKKLVGNLDYKKVRHTQTELTQKEIEYCVNDVKIVVAYITEKIKQDGHIGNICLTKTGYVRRYCRKKCLNKKSFRKYNKLMQGLTITDEEYTQLKRAFCGGFTHANAFYSGKVLFNVTSFDFTSSYPACMLLEQFPMSRGEIIKINSLEEFKKNLNIYCCLFDIKFYGLKSSSLNENYLSFSKCWNTKNCIVNNGRVVSADELETTITEQDYFIIENFYTWEYMQIGTFRRYRRGYLPKDLILAILELYKNKTKLKGIKEEYVNYALNKEMLNSVYGMCVTDIIREQIEYKTEWNKKESENKEELNLYNLNKGRFLFYPWGVWVTAYARKNLFSGIYAFGDDYIYSDTDSIKCLNVNKHMNYINAYNNNVLKKIKIICDFYKIDEKEFMPETIKGEKKVIGFWDFDGEYDIFKTIGAKRYIVKNKDGSINLTVSGIDKKTCVPFLIEKYGKYGLFYNFNNKLKIPKENTGCLTHTYIDNELKGYITDYKGNKCYVEEKSYIHLENTEKTLSISDIYLNYLLQVQKTI